MIVDKSLVPVTVASWLTKGGPVQDYSLYHQFLFLAVVQCVVTTVIIYRYALPIGLHVCHLAPTAIALTMYYIFTMN